MTQSANIWMITLLSWLITHPVANKQLLGQTHTHKQTGVCALSDNVVLELTERRLDCRAELQTVMDGGGEINNAESQSV